VRRRGGELGDGREPALRARLLARSGALGFLHLEHRSPAEIAALRALGRFEMLEAVESRDASGSTLEAFDGYRVHV
jgi:hypothetical protein